MTVWRMLAAASIWLVLSLSLWATGSRPAVIVLAGVIAAGASLVVSVIDVTRGITDTGWSRPRSSGRPRDGDPRVTQLRHQMIGARQFGSTELRDRLVSLVDDRADQALTPTLRDLLTGSPRRLGSRRTLAQTITDIEAL